MSPIASVFSPQIQKICVSNQNLRISQHLAKKTAAVFFAVSSLVQEKQKQGLLSATDYELLDLAKDEMELQENIVYQKTYDLGKKLLQFVKQGGKLEDLAQAFYPNSPIEKREEYLQRLRAHIESINNGDAQALYPGYTKEESEKYFEELKERLKI